MISVSPSGQCKLQRRKRRSIQGQRWESNPHIPLYGSGARPVELRRLVWISSPRMAIRGQPSNEKGQGSVDTWPARVAAIPSVSTSAETGGTSGLSRSEFSAPSGPAESKTCLPRRSGPHESRRCFHYMGLDASSRRRFMEFSALSRFGAERRNHPASQESQRKSLAVRVHLCFALASTTFLRNATRSFPRGANRVGYLLASAKEQ
jgi:hypothetical protein